MLILVGPSASGKTELGKLLQKVGIEKVVTYTTRPIRQGEKDGIDYHFISKEEFLEKIEQNFFFENVCYQNNYYGTAWTDILKNAYLIVEPSGLAKYKKEGNLTFFITVDYEIRKERMLKRGDSLESIQKRLASDDLIFNEKVRESCDYVLNGNLPLNEVFLEIKEILVRNGLLRV